MGIFSKLKFWGKEDNLDFDSLTSQDINPGSTTNSDQFGLQTDPTGLDNDPLLSGTPSSPSFTDPTLSPLPEHPTQSLKNTSQPLENKDLELISSKLDTIKAMLDSMDRRLASLERPGNTKEQNNLW